jgi:hypothetical protein
MFKGKREGQRITKGLALSFLSDVSASPLVSSLF